MSSLIVEVPHGKLQGKENKSMLNGKPYYSFLGIPYAKPPVGDLRFKAPQPNEKWQGIYDATFDRDLCMQNGFYSSNVLKGSENCLFLSVDIPQLPAEIGVPKPVMVFIHGGGFIAGSGQQRYFSSDYLINHDVILVRIQYRLHALGFLNLDLPDCTGNAGLKDQTLALKWVKENITYFGGDPNNITMFGISTGGSAVNFHVLSPFSKGLFNKAIVQCGSVYSPWSLTFDHKGMARKLGAKCGFVGGPDSDLLEFLKKQTAGDLTTFAGEMFEDMKKNNPGVLHLTNPFSPSVEQIKEDAFLPELPHKLQKTAKSLPLIYGIVKNEGLMGFFDNPSQIWDQLNTDFSLVLRNNFEMDLPSLPEASAKVRQYYFGDKEIGPDTTNELTDFYSDLYVYNLYEPINFAAKSTYPPFVYEFAYDGGLNLSKRLPSDDYNLARGACHADETAYIFYTPKTLPNPLLTGDDLTMIQNITKLWTNFAKTGTPADESVWAPSTFNQPQYLKIDRTCQLVEGKLYGERLQFMRNTLGPVMKPKGRRISEEYFPYFSGTKYLSQKTNKHTHVMKNTEIYRYLGEI